MEYPLAYSTLQTLIQLISGRSLRPLTFQGTPEDNPRQWLDYLEDQLELTFSREAVLGHYPPGSRTSFVGSEYSLLFDNAGSEPSSHGGYGSEEQICVPLCQWPYVAVEFMRGEVLEETMRGVMEHFSIADNQLVWNELDSYWERETSTSRRQRLQSEWERFREVLCELHGKVAELLAIHKNLSLDTAYLQAASESSVLEELGIPRPIPPLAKSSVSCFSSAAPTGTSLGYSSLSQSLTSWLSISSAPKDRSAPPEREVTAAPPSILQTRNSRLSSMLENTTSFALALGIGAIAFYGGQRSAHMTSSMSERRTTGLTGFSQYGTVYKDIGVGTR